MGLVLTANYLAGLSRTPFHPDESTQLFMSKDFQTLVTKPIALAWTPDTDDTIAQRYRLIDAPLTRYLVGFGLILIGKSPPESDWDWSADWQENQTRGSFPAAGVLLGGRITLGLLFPISLYFIYLTLTNFFGRSAGLIGVFLFGTNALVLLHTRRVMAEPALVAASALALVSLSKAPARAWFVGAAAALAFNAKHSMIAFFPIGLIAAIWLLPVSRIDLRRRIRNAIEYIAVFISLTLILNPVFWKEPAEAIQASLLERKDLLSRQVNETGQLVPGQILRLPGERTAILLAHLYITPPMVFEIGNYNQALEKDITAYLNIPTNRLFRGYIWGGLFLAGTMLGLGVGIFSIYGPDPGRRRFMILLLLYSLSQAAFIIFFVPLPWQRYSMPMVPLTTFWTAVGLKWLTETSRWCLASGRMRMLLSKILA
jgi:4-amino-4-deoxy-L-arabinose transferase-like glycosyltransferase